MAKKIKSESDRVGTYLCFLLRHKPEAAGLSVDRYGYAKVDELIETVNRDGRYYLDRQILNEIVQTDSKKRYMWNDDQTKIRACQGHSFPVDLALAPKRPPDLFIPWDGRTLSGFDSANGAEKGRTDVCSSFSRHGDCCQSR